MIIKLRKVTPNCYVEFLITAPNNDSAYEYRNKRYESQIDF